MLNNLLIVCKWTEDKRTVTLTLYHLAITVCLTSLNDVIVGSVQFEAVWFVSVVCFTHLNVLQWNDSLWFFVLMEKNFQLCIHHTHIHIYTLDTYIYLIMLLLCRTIPIGWTEFCNIIEIYNYAMKFSCITNLCSCSLPLSLSHTHTHTHTKADTKHAPYLTWVNSK